MVVAGFVLVALVVAGYYIGAYVDRLLGTGQRWAFVGLLIGFLVGFWDLYVVATRLLAEQPKVTDPIPPPPDEEDMQRND